MKGVIVYMGGLRLVPVDMGVAVRVRDKTVVSPESI